MHRRRRTSVLALLAATASAFTLSVPGPAGATPGTGAAHANKPPTAGPSINMGCAAAKPKKHEVVCDGKVRATVNSDGSAGPLVTGSATGWGPADLQSAYGLTDLTASGRTVAIVDAYDDPTAESDLGVYRSHFGLPACTTANGCFKKVGQTGTSTLPKKDPGWAEEISLDLDMVSAACPTCHILLVEASSANFSDLAIAENTAAARPGVVAISNSYGGAEDGTEPSEESAFTHPGVAITASTGDSGYGVSYPASSAHVTAVGGTSLNKASNARGWTESAWSGAGSGCSSDIPQPSFQVGLNSCKTRATADVSAVADPNTGVAVYDTTSSCGGGGLCDLLISLGVATGADGWIQVGGTSASSPIVASVYALAGNTAGITDAATPYSHTSALWDVTSGSNGSCGGTNLCTAGVGWDGPTGLGTPNGVGAF